MTKYNKVYFLHIPKTGGRFLTKYILRPIENILKDNGIELVKSPEDMRHDKELDPGSERTLAACLTHASRTKASALVAHGCVTRGNLPFASE